MVEVDLLPAEIDQLAHPEPVTVRHEDHGGIAVAPAIVPGGLDQALDLLVGWCSRVRYLAFGLRLGIVTVRKTVAGATGLAGNFIIGFKAPD